MTIAACYVSTEGVVFGADSTSTYNFGAPHHFNYGQKLFEIGENSTFGAVTWGLGGLAMGSYRTFIARLADDLAISPPTDVQDVSQRWAALVWPEFENLPEIQEVRRLHALNPFDPFNPFVAGQRTVHEQLRYEVTKIQLVVGFCIGGYVSPDRLPAAYEIIFDPVASSPSLTPLPFKYYFWGMPAVTTRLIKGCGDDVREAILASGHWTGSPLDFDTVLAPFRLVHFPTVPIREAIDFTHSCLIATVKALKFSQLSRFCGGPIEVAVITTDRKFRWVQHKPMDAAIRESDP